MVLVWVAWIFHSMVQCCWLYLTSSPHQDSPASDHWLANQPSQKRGGETWQSLLKFLRITDIYGHRKYYLQFSMSQNFNSRPKQGRTPEIPVENQLLFLIWTLQSIDPSQFLSQQYLDKNMIVIAEKKINRMLLWRKKVDIQIFSFASSPAFTKFPRYPPRPVSGKI